MLIGHTAKALGEMLGAEPAEVRALFRRTLEADRAPRRCRPAGRMAA